MLPGADGKEIIPEINFCAHLQLSGRERVDEMYCTCDSVADRERRESPKAFFCFFCWNKHQIILTDGGQFNKYRMLIEIRIAVAVMRYELFAALIATRESAGTESHKSRCCLLVREMKIKTILLLDDSQQFLQQLVLLQHQLLQE